MRRAGNQRSRRWWFAFPLVLAAGVAAAYALVPRDTPLPPDLAAELPADVIALRFPAGWGLRAPLTPAAFALARVPKVETLARTSPLDLLSQPLLFEQAHQELARLQPYITEPPDDSARSQVPLRARRENALFTDGQIASIKARLKLTPEQEALWPEVASALEDITWRGANSRKATLDPKSLGRVVLALGPFVKSLRPEQKDELRALAHVMGLEHLASQL